MLTLPTKKKWFDMILSGEKLEEYRNGYRKDSPSFIRTVIPHYRRGGRPEWGAEPDKDYIVLTIQQEEN